MLWRANDLLSDLHLDSLIGRHSGQKVESSCGYKPLGSAEGGFKHVPPIGSPFDLIEALDDDPTDDRHLVQIYGNRKNQLCPILLVIGCQSSNL